MARGSIPLEWTEEHEQGFKNLKEALMQSPHSFSLISSSPFIFMFMKKGNSQVILTQTLRPWKRPMTYMSKRLDPIASGWYFV